MKKFLLLFLIAASNYGMNQDMRIDGAFAPLKPAVIKPLFELCAEILIPYAVEDAENLKAIASTLKNTTAEEQFKKSLLKKHDNDLAYIAFEAPKEYIFKAKFIDRSAYSPDGKQYADASYSGITITILNPITQECVKVIKTTTSNPIIDVAYSPDSKHFVVAFNENIAIWNTATWECINEVKTFRTVDAITFSPDGTQFATLGMHKGIISLWDPITWTVVKQIFEKYRTAHIEFSPDSKQLISYVSSNTIRAWWRGEDRPLEELLQIVRDKKRE